MFILYIYNIFSTDGKYFRNKLSPIILFLILVELTIFSNIQYQIFILAVLTVLIFYIIGVLFYYKNNKNKDKRGISIAQGGNDYLKNGSVIFCFVSLVFLTIMIILNNAYECPYFLCVLLENNQSLFSSIIQGNITLVGLSIFLTVYPKDKKTMMEELYHKDVNSSSLKKIILGIFFPFNYSEHIENDNRIRRFKNLSHLLVWNIALSVLIVLLCFLGIILGTSCIMLPILNISSVFLFSWIILCSETVILFYEVYLCWEVYKTLIGVG